MARNEHTAETFDTLADELAECVSTLRAISAQMKESGIPHALIHGSTPQKIYVPSLIEWIDKTQADVKTQIRSYLTGMQSKAEVHKQRNEVRKAAAAKKPWPKKAAKKKAE